MISEKYKGVLEIFRDAQRDHMVLKLKPRTCKACVYHSHTFPSHDLIYISVVSYVQLVPLAPIPQ